MSKSILITGCSSGLGFALANLYLEKNYKVYGISRTKPNIDNKNFFFKSFDLNNTSKIKNDLNSFITNIKEIDTVFLNAGMLGEIKTLKDLSLDEIKEVTQINVYANKELLDILSDMSVKNIIAISSGASKNGSKGWGAYSLSKAGINMLINLYANELENTKLLAVAPGVIKTPMTDYIRYEIDDTIFTSAKRLKEGEIQTASDAAKRLDNLVSRIDEFESGSFVDVRNV
ncbi:MAG: SDR family NAD(P)-dependent oxidoreductase [Poseidonibacter sp.]|uniref:SDR family NAD(P)-dependent oxidoreductase n=1 Tax=Poseidonibacter sp. TaxID=2321188 RepID=UPI00359D4202